MIKVFSDKIFYTNTYLLIKEDICIVIDPGFSYNEVLKYISDKNLRVEAILATHGHIDHVIGVEPLKRSLGTEFYMNPRDLTLKIDIDFYGIRDVSIPRPDHDIWEGSLKISSFRLDIIETPGHTMGSITIIYDRIAFTGDTLFRDAIGRTDLGGDMDMLIKSIHNKLFTLPKNMLIYPGHGDYSTIGYEIINNPYVGINGVYPFKLD